MLRISHEAGKSGESSPSATDNSNEDSMAWEGGICNYQYVSIVACVCVCVCVCECLCVCGVNIMWS